MRKVKNRLVKMKLKGGIKQFMRKCLWALCLFLLVGTLFGQKFHSLATKFSDVILSGMKPGMVYSIRKEKGIPYTVLNHASGKRDIEVIIKKPNKSQIKPNYEPVPDVSWVSIFPTRFALEEGEEMVCDIIISIPPDEKYNNRHFQAMIVATSAGKPGGQGFSLNFALASRIRFSTARRPEKVLEEYRQKVFSALNLEMSPMSLFLRDLVPAGEKIRLGGEIYPTVQVVNKSRRKHKINFHVTQNPRDYGIMSDYELLPKEIKVKLKKKKMKSKAKSILDVVIELEVPDKEEFCGKSYAFVIVGNVLGFDIPIELFSRIYFKTKERKK